MSDTGSTHIGAAHHEEHAPGHDPESAGEPPGPVDVTAWAYAIIGSMAGFVVALALLVARGV